MIRLAAVPAAGNRAAPASSALRRAHDAVTRPLSGLALRYWLRQAGRGAGRGLHFARRRHATPEHRHAPIDAVYTWVDASDPAWRARQRARLEALGADAGDTGDEQFIDRDELRYSLRSLHRYAPWIRQVYILTDRQVPAWLDTAYPRVTVVDHREVFPDTSVLPVFNSQAIESCLHRIDGLSRRFLYLNDDFFLGRPVAPSDFLSQDGKLRARVRDSRGARSQATANLPFMWANRRGHDLVQQRHGSVEFGPMLDHVPHLLDRDLMADVERIWPEVDATRASPFRSRTDVAPVMLVLLYAVATGRAVREKLPPWRSLHVPTGRHDVGLRLLWLRAVRPSFYCLNATKDDDLGATEQAQVMRAFLSTVLPQPSPFERTAASSPSVASVPAARERPLITAGVTAYNAQESIERAVQSALAQTWRPLEVLIVDDGSSDGTPGTLERLAATHSEIRVVVHEENRGTATARNTLIEHARGQAIAFFDDDDVSHPDRIARQWERLTTYEQQHGGGAPILCHTGVRVVYPDGSSSEHPGVGWRPTGAVSHGDRLIARLLWGYRLPADDRGVARTCSQLGRPSTYRDVGMFDPSFRRSEDSELNVRVARAGGHLIGIREPLVVQELVPATDRTTSIEWLSHLQLLNKHKDAFPSNQMYLATMRWTEAKYTVRSGERWSAGKLLSRAALVHPVYVARRTVAYALDTVDYLDSRRGLRGVYADADGAPARRRRLREVD